MKEGMQKMQISSFIFFIKENFILKTELNTIYQKYETSYIK